MILQQFWNLVIKVPKKKKKKKNHFLKPLSFEIHKGKKEKKRNVLSKSMNWEYNVVINEK
jgi:hypothetical protein